MSSAAAKIPDLRNIEMPYMLRVYGVTEQMFDEMVEDEDTKAELVADPLPDPLPCLEAILERK
jgi:hypothetical protein